MTARELVETGYGNAEILINGIPLEEYQLTCAEEVVDYIKNPKEGILFSITTQKVLRITRGETT